MPSVDEVIVRAVDRQDAREAGRLADFLRGRGWTYNQILARVQELRPAVSAAAWDDLLAEADDLDAAGG